MRAGCHREPSHEGFARGVFARRGGIRGRSGCGAATGDPVVVTAPGGAYAVAVPGFAGGPALAGDSVAFAVQDPARERLFRVGVASASGWRTLYVAPRRPRLAAGSIAASASRVVVSRHRPGRTQTCVAGGECTPSPDDVLAGSPAESLRRLVGFTERLPSRGSCRRRIAQLQDDVSLSGDRIAYARRVRCLAPRRPGRSQVVVRDVATGAVRVVHRGAADRVSWPAGTWRSSGTMTASWRGTCARVASPTALT